MSLARAFRSLAALALLGALAACAKKGSETAPQGDFAATCATRAAYTQSVSMNCVRCELAVEDPKSCACLDAPAEWKGTCKAATDAVRATPGCLERDGCVRACKGDCACSAACYAGDDACKAKAVARDSCKVNICRDSCK